MSHEKCSENRSGVHLIINHRLQTIKKKINRNVIRFVFLLSVRLSKIKAGSQHRNVSISQIEGSEDE